jgi:hypothetical protein
MLAALFGIISVVGMRLSFLSRALAAVGLSFVLAVTVLLISNVSAGRVQRTLSDEMDRRVSIWAAAWEASSQTPEWQRFAGENPRVARLMEQAEMRWRGVPEVTLRLFPSLLALESLAALALGWGLFHRISRTRVGPPLAPLRELRFGDQMVWGFLAGIAMITIPTLSGLRGLGLNLTFFFAAVYALRGLGVITWFVAPRRLAAGLLVVLGVIFWPVFGILSLGIGLGDVWIDWRARARQMTS